MRLMCVIFNHSPCRPNEYTLNGGDVLPGFSCPVREIFGAGAARRKGVR